MWLMWNAQECPTSHLSAWGQIILRNVSANPISRSRWLQRTNWKSLCVSHCGGEEQKCIPENVHWLSHHQKKNNPIPVHHSSNRRHFAMSIRGQKVWQVGPEKQVPLDPHAPWQSGENHFYLPSGVLDFIWIPQGLTGVSAPVLVYADPAKPFELHVDTSREGLGGVLYQEHDIWDLSLMWAKALPHLRETILPISCGFSLWSVMNKLKEYLYKAKFEVMKDNNHSHMFLPQLNWMPQDIDGWWHCQGST